MTKPSLVVEDDRVLARASDLRSKYVELTDLEAELEIATFQLTIRPEGKRFPIRLHRPAVTIDEEDVEWIEGGRAWLVERVERLAAAESASS